MNSSFIPIPDVHPYSTQPPGVLTGDIVTLEICQHPKTAVVTQPDKEKQRQPVDPPPIIRLHVNRKHDPERAYLFNPFLFMTATLVQPDADEHGEHPAVKSPTVIGRTVLIGQTVSSLYRLKWFPDNGESRDEETTPSGDQNSQSMPNDVGTQVESGYFGFGDISCRRQGTYRLRFELWDLDKPEGLSEPTPLLTALSKEGMRPKLRKGFSKPAQPPKRSYDNCSTDYAPHATLHPYGAGFKSDENDPRWKRARTEGEESDYDAAMSNLKSQQVVEEPRTAWIDRDWHVGWKMGQDVIDASQR